MEETPLHRPASKSLIRYGGCILKALQRFPGVGKLALQLSHPQIESGQVVSEGRLFGMLAIELLVDGACLFAPGDSGSTIASVPVGKPETQILPPQVP